MTTQTATTNYDRDKFRGWLINECDDLTDATQEFLAEDPYNILQDPECWIDRGMTEEVTLYLSRLYDACNKDARSAVEELRNLSFLVHAQSVFIDNLLVCAVDLAEAEIEEEEMEGK